MFTIDKLENSQRFFESLKIRNFLHKLTNPSYLPNHLHTISRNGAHTAYFFAARKTIKNSTKQRYGTLLQKVPSDMRFRPKIIQNIRIISASKCSNYWIIQYIYEPTLPAAHRIHWMKLSFQDYIFMVNFSAVYGKIDYFHFKMLLSLNYYVFCTQTPIYVRTTPTHLWTWIFNSIAKFIRILGNFHALFWVIWVGGNCESKILISFNFVFINIWW